MPHCRIQTLEPAQQARHLRTKGAVVQLLTFAAGCVDIVRLPHAISHVHRRPHDRRHGSLLSVAPCWGLWRFVKPESYKRLLFQVLAMEVPEIKGLGNDAG